MSPYLAEFLGTAILILLGATGMVVGVLNSYDRFAAFAISPFFWNVVIILGLILLLLGLLAGVFSFITVFGSILSSVPIVAVALASGPTGFSLSTGLAMLGWIVGIHFPAVAQAVVDVVDQMGQRDRQRQVEQPGCDER